ncbi:MAG: hypothetical protein KAU50_07160 [Candidatus Marinimicrobia bacterium]|nr:hypothetical protein [Candidatus Neomarinimicrobiota bacterium]
MADEPILGEVMDLDTFKSYHVTPSVNKDVYWKSDPIGNLAAAPLQDTAVYNGNFLTQYLNRTGQAFAGVFVGIPGGVVAQEGAFIKDEGGIAGSIIKKAMTVLKVQNPAIANILDIAGIDERAERFIGERLDGTYEKHLERSELLGEKMVNYGIYMADVGKEIVNEMERAHPTTNPYAKFLGDATGSILATVGLYSIGGPAVPILVFGASSGLDVGTEALREGHDSDTALAATLLVGATVSGLESIGLKAIFGTTAKTGIRAAATHIMIAMATEGITEGLQTVVEIGGGMAVGGQKEMTLLDFVSQVAYASAVGAFAGGAMVSSVTMAQRYKAINAMEEALGVDRGTAKALTQGAEQAALEEVFSRVGEDTGYDTIQNRKYQNMRDIISLARGEGNVTNDAAQRILDSLKIVTPGEQLLNDIRGQAIADVNAEIDEKIIKGRTVTGEKAVSKAAQVLEQSEREQAAELEEFVPIGPEVVSEVEPIYRQAYIGRIQELTRVAKDAKKALLAALRLQGAREGKINTQTIRGHVQTYIDATSRLTYLKENPRSINFSEGKIQLKNAEVLARIADEQTVLILRNVKNNFRRGQRASRAEVAYVKTAIKQLLDRPGIAQTQRFEELGRWLNRINTPEQLQKRFAELEGKIDAILQQNLIATFTKSIDNATKIMRGKKIGITRRIALSARAQKLADTFLSALKQKDIDPAETAAKIHTAEGLMRTLAARLVTGINPDGSPLTSRDYMNIDRTLRNFIREGSLESEKVKAIEKKTAERQRERVIEELDRTGALAKTPPREAWERIMDFVSRRFNYDALVGSLAKGMGTEMGSSVFENIMDFSKAHIKNETLYSYFTSVFNQKSKKIFGLNSTLDLSKKFLADNVDENQVVISKEKADGVLDPFWNGTIAKAREKYMLWLSPEGQQIMKDQGWTEGEIEDLVDNLSESDMAFIAMQLELYGEMWPMVNETFRKTKGYDLSYREKYSPVYRTGIDFQNSNMIDQLLGRAPVDPSMRDPRFTKELSHSEKKLNDVADFQKIRHYIKDASYYAAMAPKIIEVQNVINKSDVRDKIISVRDEDFYGRLKKYVDIMAQGRRYGTGNLNSSMNNAVTNMQKMLLAGKVILLPKQLVSSMAALEVVNGTDFAEYMKDLPAALKDGRLSELLEHPYFAYRSMRRAISRDIFDMNAAFEKGQISPRSLQKAGLDLTLNHYLFLATQLGDMGGVVLNGWAVYNHYLKEGLSKPEAANKAVGHIDRTQQSARATQQIGISLDPNPIVRAFTSFTHAPMQYASILVQQLDTLGTDRFRAKQFARTFGVFFTLLPIVYNAIGRAFNYREDEMPQYLAEFALGPFDDIPVAGGLLRVLVARATYNVYKNTVDEDVKLPYSARWDAAATGLFSSMTKNLADVERALTKEYDDGMSLADFLNITTQLSEATGPIGGMYSGLSRTISGAAQGIALMSEENGDGTTVNSTRRLLMSLGYSEYATRPTEE